MSSPGPSPQGDPVALELIDGAIVALGTAIASACTLVDITTVVLGGGITEKLGAEFVTRVDAAVQAASSPASPSTWSQQRWATTQGSSAQHRCSIDEPGRPAARERAANGG